MNIKTMNSHAMIAGLLFIFLICTAEECETIAQEYKAETFMLMSAEQQLDDCRKGFPNNLERCKRQEDGVALFRGGIIPPPPPPPPCPEPANCSGLLDIMKRLVYPTDQPVVVEITSISGDLLAKGKPGNLTAQKFKGYNQMEFSIRDKSYTGKAIMTIHNKKTGVKYPMNIVIGQ